METAITVFLWIVGALCLFVIAFLTYDIIVWAQDRKAKKNHSSEENSSQEGGEPVAETSTSSNQNS